MRNLVKKALTAWIAGTSEQYIFNTLLYFLKVFTENNHTPPPPHRKQFCCLEGSRENIVCDVVGELN